MAMAPGTVRGGGASVSPSGPFVSGRYYVTPENQNAGTSAALGVGTLRVMMFNVPNNCTLSRIGAEVVTIGDVGSKFRLGIYADDGTGRPGALLVDAGVIAGDSATVQELVINLPLGAGNYWIGGAVQVVTTTQPTMRTITQGGNAYVEASVGAAPPSNWGNIGFAMTGVAGALPNPFVFTGYAGSVARPFVKAL